jgi:hypothetical protein
MAQETGLWEKETSNEVDRTARRTADGSATGRDMPSGDGGVGQEQVNAIGSDDSGKPIGQDHSTDVENRQEPTDGVGGVQDANVLGSDIADISE